MNTTMHTQGTPIIIMSLTKRAFDISAATVALLMLTPLICIVALLVRLKLGAPVVFRQQRPGLHGRIFTMFKFRTMTDERDQHGALLSDEYRLTAFGRFLRSTSLDELPELLNVIKGDMSLVGPRPLMPSYLSLYTAQQMRRHDVMPGITGWAQVNGRNAISWDEKFNLDIWYVENCSLLLDIKILVLTVLKVVRRDDISQDGHVTAESFQGQSGQGSHKMAA